MKKTCEVLKIIFTKYFLSRKGLAYLSFLIWFNIYMFRVLFTTQMMSLYVLWSLEAGLFILLGIISFEKIKLSDIVDVVKD